MLKNYEKEKKHTEKQKDSINLQDWTAYLARNVGKMNN